MVDAVVESERAVAPPAVLEPTACGRRPLPVDEMLAAARRGRGRSTRAGIGMRKRCRSPSIAEASMPRQYDLFIWRKPGPLGGTDLLS